MRLPSLALVGLVTFAALTTAPAQFFFYEPAPVYVVKTSQPKVFDPYYNRVKVSRAPVYVETKEIKKKGNKEIKKTVVTNQYGHVVYKNTTVKKKKK